MMTRQWLFVFCLIFSSTIIHAKPNEVFVSEDPANGYLPLIKDGQPLQLQIDPQDDKGVLRAVDSLQRDFERVAGKRAEVTSGSKSAIWIGTVGQSTLIDDLIVKGQLPKNEIAGKREKFIITVVEQP